MTDRVRILLVAAPGAPVRGLSARLDEPDVEVAVCDSAAAGLAQLDVATPTVLVLDGGLARRDLARLRDRLRSSPDGAGVPIVWSGLAPADTSLADPAAPDYVLDPEATLEDLEQLLFAHCPDAPAAEPTPDPSRDPAAPRPPARPRPLPDSRPREPAPPSAALGAVAEHPPLAALLVYLGIYLTAELLAASLDTRLGLLVHGGLLLGLLFHGTNVPPGPERACLWGLWLAPLARIYGLALPFAGAPPPVWWALTAVPMVVAGLVAMRLAGLTPRACGLIPAVGEAPVALLMAPAGLALGLVGSLLIAPRAPTEGLGVGALGLVALAVILNPGIVDEVVFRGVLQRAVAGWLGARHAILVSALASAPVVPAGLLAGASAVAILFQLGAGLALAALTARTGSILSASVGHASLAVGLVVLGPLLLPAGPEPAAPSTLPPSSDARLAPTKPAVIVASPPSALAPPSGPPALPGLPPPATPITLATPLPPPVAASPGAAPAPGQAVVVRGTGGAGARLRAQPGSSAPTVAVLPENTRLLVIGSDRLVDGIVWRNVRTLAGAEGWVAVTFIAPVQEP